MTNNYPLWMQAIDKQLLALQVIRKLNESAKRFADNPTVSGVAPSWKIDQHLLSNAEPFGWSDEVVRGCLEASKTIPAETVINTWNFDTAVVWWYFETPLPFYPDHRMIGVRAIALGNLRFRPKGTTVERAAVVCTTWTDDYDRRSLNLIPSQVFEWEAGQTLGEMLESTVTHHRKIYGPGGKFEHSMSVPEEQFMAVAEGTSRFILAACAWLRQKAAVSTEHPVLRQRRKEFKKEVGREIKTIKVIQLRRSEQEGDSSVVSDPSFSYSHRFVVGGHWRNQACGTGMKDRRLVYIHPYVKGPDDKPLVTKARVYEVSR